MNAIVRYAQEYTTCRKIFFEKYFFLESGNLQFQDQGNNDDDSNTLLVNQTTPDTPCGICDNCVRDRSTVVMYDISTEAVTLVTILRALKGLNNRVTLLKLMDIWKGKGLKALHLDHLKQNTNICVPVDSKYSDTVSLPSSPMTFHCTVQRYSPFFYNTLGFGKHYQPLDC